MRTRIKDILFLFKEYRITNDEWCLNNAEALLDNAIEECTGEKASIEFVDLCRLGIAIEYLTKEGFIEGDVDVILADIDTYIMATVDNRPQLDLNIKHGMLILALYLYERLYYRIQSESSHILDLKECTIYLIDWIFDSMLYDTVDKNYQELYYVLMLLRKLDLFNSKIDRISKLCKEEIA